MTKLEKLAFDRMNQLVNEMYLPAYNMHHYMQNVKDTTELESLAKKEMINFEKVYKEYFEIKEAFDE